MDCPQCISSRSLQTGCNVQNSWLIKAGRMQADRTSRTEAFLCPVASCFQTHISSERKSTVLALTLVSQSNKPQCLGRRYDLQLLLRLNICDTLSAILHSLHLVITKLNLTNYHCGFSLITQHRH